jgi:hypothetical protein
MVTTKKEHTNIFYIRSSQQRRKIPIFSTGDGDNKEGTYQYFLQEMVTTKKEHTNIFYRR